MKWNLTFLHPTNISSCLYTQLLSHSAFLTLIFNYFKTFIILLSYTDAVSINSGKCLQNLLYFYLFHPLIIHFFSSGNQLYGK